MINFMYRKMNKLLLLTLISFYACNSKPELKSMEKSDREETTHARDSNKTEAKSTQEHIKSNAEAAKTWLIAAIEKHFTTLEGNMQEICTPEYYEYKRDATSVGYDGSMSQDEFEKKWKNHFDTKYAGTGVAFLLCTQDWEKITVKSCKLSGVAGKEGVFVYSFQTEIYDEVMKFTCKRDIKVQEDQGKFLIADVFE